MAGMISIYESEVSCLSSILDLQRRCMKENVAFSTETNRFLLHLTLKKVGPWVAQKVVSKLVAQGEITWEADEDFEVEQILDYADEDNVLNEPVIKMAEAKDVRWLSHDRAASAIRKCLPALVTSLEYEANEKADAQAAGLSIFVQRYDFVAAVHMMCDILPLLSSLSRCFQTRDGMYNTVGSLVAGTIASIRALKENPGQYYESVGSVMTSLCEQPFRFAEPTQRQKGEFHTNVYQKFIDSIIENLVRRFPDITELDAFRVFNAQTWPEDQAELDFFGNEEIQGVEFYLIKWRGWSHAHNSWEPKDNLECADLILEYHAKNNLGVVKAGAKRKFDEIKSPEEDREQKRTRIDELYSKLITCKETMTPLKLISLTSPDKGKAKSYRGLVSCEGRKVPKFNNTAKQSLNPRSKAYKSKKIEIKKALLDWQNHMNSVGIDPAKITVENDVDLEGPPENFEYINDYKPGPGIVIPNDPIIGCECTDCWGEKIGCCAHQFGVEFAYYKQKRLKVLPGRPIYECNKRCTCGPECSNRVVQQGRKHKVCIFRTKNGRGWGVKANQKIKAGTFVMEYVGEVISSEEAEIRGQTYDAVGRTYLFDLDFNDGDCPFTVDAAVYGNVSHFVNHSCDPNMEVYSVWINTLDPRLPRIALFSRRDIEKGEELTFDYMSSKAHTPLLESNDKTQEEETVETQEEEANETADESTENGSVEADKTELNSAVEIVDLLDFKAPSEPTESEPKEAEPKDTSKPGADGDAGSKSIVNSSPKKQTKVEADLYRMVCQCGAKNCRKFVF